MTDSDEKNDLITILKGEKRTWFVQVEYYPNNLKDNEECLVNNIMQVTFKIKTISESEAKIKAIEIYENEFGINGTRVAQQNIEDTDALQLNKFVDGKYNLKISE
tara:strand:+ start:293 stop:607 length:315 start_codon:yes stop_codon:yes gene_type:complete